MGLIFWKMTGAGNDFIAVNNMEGGFTAEGEARKALIAELCARGTGVGADGFLLTESSGKAAFKMRYYNSDGGEAETCGNGARCIARFANLQGLAPERMTFETVAGLYEAEVKPETVKVSMSDAHSLETDVTLSIPGLFDGEVDFCNTGVPHVVLRVEDLEAVPLVELGRAIRTHERFDPPGTNVNFIAPAEGANHFEIRTYERGVEGETLACGTGSIASAIIAVRRGLAQAPVRMTTRSGVTLTIGFEPTEGGARAVTLEGEARVVYRGETA